MTGMKKETRTATLVGALALALAWGHAGLAEEAEADEAEANDKFEYVVENGHVDASTMVGWEVYTGSCMACHGPDGVGSSFAPSLLRVAERRTFDDFAITIAEGLSIRPGMVMPSFAGDSRVMSHVVDIWNYLGARLEGGLPRGRPRLLEDNADAEEVEEQG
jgi:mono/diheme cytochrome c family protein